MCVNHMGEYCDVLPAVILVLCNGGHGSYKVRGSGRAAAALPRGWDSPTRKGFTLSPEINAVAQTKENICLTTFGELNIILKYFTQVLSILSFMLPLNCISKIYLTALVTSYC